MKRGSFAARFWIGLGVAGLACVQARGGKGPDGDEPVPDFRLGRWKSEAKVQLSDFAGKVLVLDFFAHWCVPCQRASAELESLVRRHYAKAGGNPQGVPVEVLSINVESGAPARTEAFIRRAGLSLVANDEEGATLRAYGGTSLPHVVILDGTGATHGRQGFRIVYRQGGYEGARKLRGVIDRVGPSARAAVEGRRGRLERRVRERLEAMLGSGRLPMWAAASGVEGLGDGSTDTRGTADGPAVSPAEGATEETFGGTPIDHRSSLGFDGLFASDVQLSQETLVHRTQGLDWEASASVGLATLGLDYEPVAFDFLGSPRRVEATRGFVQGAIRWRAMEGLTVLGGGGYYDGFTDYRSLWLSEYYRQQFAPLPGYSDPSPSGHQASLGLRWEAIPASAFLQVDFAYLNDEIAPGYEIDFSGLRQGRPYLYTSVFRLSWEQILHRRVRWQHEMRRVDTADRDDRYGYRGALNLALADRWTLRLQGGATTEQPQFDAWYAGGTVDYELSQNWAVSAGGRYYEDSGEIENSNFSNAAPPLTAWHLSLGVRYVRDGWTGRVLLAPYATRYGAFGIGTAFFQNLYADRDWLLAQAAVEVVF